MTLGDGLKLGQALFNMNDGIHMVTDFMWVRNGKITYTSPMQEMLPVNTDMHLISRNDFLEYLETVGATDSDLEKPYGTYNTFAKADDSEDYFAYYDNDR